MYKKNKLIYEGKAKKIYNVLNFDNLICIEFKNDLTAFNGKKKDQFENKGLINQKISWLAFSYLKTKKIPVHFVSCSKEIGFICENLKMIPLELVIRNFSAGSYKERTGIPEGQALNPIVLEFFYKSDELGDPLLSQEEAFKYVKNQREWDQLLSLGKQINKELSAFFDKAGFLLVDFKLEFGKNSNSELLLGDELSPDNARIWEKNSLKKLDKDVFRYDLGSVKDSYLSILKSLEKQWSYLIKQET